MYSVSAEYIGAFKRSLVMNIFYKKKLNSLGK